MGRGLKTLIALACAAITSFVGYFFWSEYQKSRQQEMLTIMAMCDAMMSDLKSNKTDRDWRLLHVVKCIEEGNLTERDFEKIGKQQIYIDAKRMIKAKSP